MNEPATTLAASPSRVFSRLGGATRVWLLVGLVATVAVVLNGTVVGHLAGPERNVQIPWYVLAALFYLVEANVVHLHFRREAHSISFSEVPMVLGLFFT